MEALGASTARPPRSSKRLLQAVNDLRHSEAARDALKQSAVRLAQVAGEFAKKPDCRSQTRPRSRAESASTKSSRGVAATCSTKPRKPPHPRPTAQRQGQCREAEMGCVSINLGSQHGVKVGMPFQVRRGDKVIATVRVVDARQTFAEP
jgi:hypothetical protein